MNLKHFDISEFASPDAPNSGAWMNSNTLQLLDQARSIANVPFKINSGYRTKSYNRKVGGNANSSHMRGYAADIRVRNNTERWKILNSLIKVGFKRIGLYRNFIHVDNDPNKNPSIWFIDSKNPIVKILSKTDQEDY